MEFHEPQGRYSLDHNLHDVLREVSKIKKRKNLENSELYQVYAPQLLALEHSVEWRNDCSAAPVRPTLRVVHWNIERGRNLEGIIATFRTNSVLRDADIILLTESDIGMARSGNRNICAELSDALQMNYVFCNSFIALSKGDEGEQNVEGENTLALHGVAVLSKYPIHSYFVQPLATSTDFFESREKRFGRKKGLICRFDLNGTFVDVAVVHLEVRSSPRHRAMQMESLLSTLQKYGAEKVIIGGDLNSTTFRMDHLLGFLQSATVKSLMGVRRTIAHYMKPDSFFERPLFEMLRKYGFEWAPYNDPTKGTLHFDLARKSIITKLDKNLSPAGTRIFRRALRPWGGRVPLRLDWFVARNMAAIHGGGLPTVIENPLWNTQEISDHYPIVVDLLYDLAGCV